MIIGLTYFIRWIWLLGALHICIVLLGARLSQTVLLLGIIAGLCTFELLCSSNLLHRSSIALLPFIVLDRICFLPHCIRLKRTEMCGSSVRSIRGLGSIMLYWQGPQPSRGTQLNPKLETAPGRVEACNTQREHQLIHGFRAGSFVLYMGSSLNDLV